MNIEHIVEHCRKELNIPFETEVDIVKADLTVEDVKGWCYGADGEYVIELEKSLDDDELLITLCHEMVHVKQYSDGKNADEGEAYELEGILATSYGAKGNSLSQQSTPTF